MDEIKTNEPRFLKRVVIKEELVALTGDYKTAILLNQMIYWSQRTKDSDKFLNEEMERAKKFGTQQDIEKIESLADAVSHGWIYKKAEELSDECMIGMSAATMGRQLQKLIDNKWLDVRSNPKFKWDRMKQYRVNIIQIQRDLQKLGYSLEGYSLLQENDNRPEPDNIPSSDKSSEDASKAAKTTIFQNENSNFQQNDTSIFQNEKSNFQNEKCNFQNEKCNFQNEKCIFQNENAIPEITTNNTTNNTSYITSSSSSFQSDDIVPASRKEKTDDDEKRNAVKQINQLCESLNFKLSLDEISMLLLTYNQDTIKQAIITAVTMNNDIKLPLKYLITVLNDMNKDKTVNINKTVNGSAEPKNNSNRFNDFEQRAYTNDQMQSMELKLLGL